MSNLQEILNSVIPNTSIRTDCPFCDRKNTFSVTHNGYKIRYNCFSNSCKRSRNIDIVPTTIDLQHMLKQKGATEEIKEFRLPSYAKTGLVSERAFTWMYEHNGLKAYKQGFYKVGYDTLQDRIIYMLVSEGNIVGAIGRALTKAYPKVLIYESSKIMPFISGNSDVCVIVEDCASAASISAIEGYTGFALLGTVFKPEYVPYIKKYRKVYIALDPDARVQAMRLRVSLEYIARNVSIWNIPTDFKNMKYEDIQEFIKLTESSYENPL